MVKKLLSKIFGCVTRFRNVCFDKGLFSIYVSELPVISVGNLTVGGNGKTPLVILLVQKLREKGHTPCVLTRGYGGTMSGPYLLSLDDDSKKVGDEPLLIARKARAPVVIAAKRVAGAQFIESQKLGDVIILDDGFQHRWLHRDVDVVSIDTSTEPIRQAYLAGELLPLGRFRENRDLGLMRATTVVLSDRLFASKPAEPDARIVSRIPDQLSVFRAYYSSLELVSVIDDTSLPIGEIVVVTAIANPQGFLNSLEKKGYKIRSTYAFRDHHYFSEAELLRIEAQHKGFPICCTEKDSVKIVPRQGWYVAKGTFTVYPDDAFISHIRKLFTKKLKQNPSPS